MTTEEVFSQLAAHMQKGIILHRELSEIYNFLCLKGYKKCHYYHQLDETQNYYYLYHYYMDHYHKLIEVEIEDPKIIPIAWYKHTQFEVDTSTKRTAIRDTIKQWIEWEKSTKELLQKSYKELYDLGEFAAAMKIQEFLCDVDKELKDAEREFIDLETVGYSIDYISEKQDAMIEKYRNKIKKLF